MSSAVHSVKQRGACVCAAQGAQESSSYNTVNLHVLPLRLELSWWPASLLNLLSPKPWGSRHAQFLKRALLNTEPAP